LEIEGDHTRVCGTEAATAALVPEGLQTKFEDTFSSSRHSERSSRKIFYRAELNL